MEAAPESIGQPGRANEILERREYERHELGAPALLDAASSWHKATCENVSLGGVKVQTDAALQLGTEVEVYFELPSGVAVETRARVVWVTDGELALCFLALDGEAASALRSFCR
jgi:hypothetical protein